MPDGHDARVLALAAGRRLGLVDPVVRPLSGGSRNHSFRLTGGGRDLAVRIAGAHDAAYEVARAAESRVHRLAAAHGLAPAVVLDDPASGLLVTEFVEGRVWSRDYARSAEGLGRMAAWLDRLHAIEVPAGLRRVDFAASLRSYRGSLRDVLPARLLRRAAEVGEELAADGAATICHHDLHHRNLIDSATGLLAVDWEYAGAGHPVMDLAGYCAYHELDAAATGRLLGAYDGGRLALLEQRLAAARWLFEAVWLGWLELRLRLEGGEPPESAESRHRLAARLGLATDRPGSAPAAGAARRVSRP